MALLTTLLSAAGGHLPPPVIDIDGTLFLQLGIFLTLFVVMRKFVFSPYLEAKRERESTIEGARSRAEATEEETHSKLARYERRVFEARREAAAGRSLARAQGEAKSQALLVSARGKADSKLQEVRAKIATSVPAAELALRTRADELAKAVACKVLGRSL